MITNGWRVELRVPGNGKPRITYLHQVRGPHHACKWVEGSPTYSIVKALESGNQVVESTGAATQAFADLLKYKALEITDPTASRANLSVGDNLINNGFVAATQDEAQVCFGMRTPKPSAADPFYHLGKSLSLLMAGGAAVAAMPSLPQPIMVPISAQAHLGKPYDLAPGVTGTPVSHDESELPDDILVRSPWVTLLVSPEAGGRPAEIVAAVTSERSCTQKSDGLATRGASANTSNANDMVNDVGLRVVRRFFFGKSPQPPASSLPDILKKVAAGPCLGR